MDNRPSSRPQRGNNKALGRAVRYLAHYRREALLPYFFMVIATIAQLMVPRVISHMIDVITLGSISNQIVPRLNQIPANILTGILQQLNMSVDQLRQNQTLAERLLIYAGLAILALALIRGLFAFLQTYWGERNSQGVAFDMRNELFAKIQRLSFSYHDRNQTGQLMIRATDDVEKVRLFIGQGLLLAASAVLLLSGTLMILLRTNLRVNSGRAAHLADCLDPVHGIWEPDAAAVHQGAAQAFRA